MSVFVLPDCPTTCAGTVGSVEFNECAPEVHFGEIARLYLWALDDIPFATQADFDSIGHWASHVSEGPIIHTGLPVDPADPIRVFTVIGEMPEPEQTEVPISGDRVIQSPKKFILNLEIDETNDTNYNFMLLSECGGKYKGVFETADGIVYGGYQGLEFSIKMNQPIPKTRQEVVKITAKVTWTSKNHPLRQWLTIA